MWPRKPESSTINKPVVHIGRALRYYTGMADSGADSGDDFEREDFELEIYGLDQSDEEKEDNEFETEARGPQPYRFEPYRQPGERSLGRTQQDDESMETETVPRAGNIDW